MAGSYLTLLGEEWVVDRIVATGGTYSSYTGAYVGWGTAATGGTASVNKSNTALSGESTNPGSTNRVSGTISKTGTGATAKWQNVATITSTGAASQNINEAGCFSASGAATLFIVGDFTSIPVNQNESIQFTFTLDPS